MGKNLVITLLSALLVIAVTAIVVTTWQNHKRFVQEQIKQEQENFTQAVITIDDRIEEWKIEKEWDKSYDIYLNLSEEILRKILVKVGTEADIPTITQEYLSNINYYITSLIKDKISLSRDSIPGVDSLKIQLEALKVNKEKNIPITASEEDK